MSRSGEAFGYLEAFPSDWIEDAELRRKAMTSTVICFETSDPVRVEQSPRHRRRVGGEPFFVFDRWRGLRAEGAVEPDEEQGLEGGSREVTSLEVALRQVDARMAATRSAGRAPDLVIADLMELRVQAGEVLDWRLVDALRAWVRETQPYMCDFSVYVFAPSAQIFDEQTRRHFIVVPVPVSLPEERQAVIEHVAGELEVEADVQGLVDLTSGLDIGQLASALRESYFRTERFDAALLREVKARVVHASGLLELEEPVHGFDQVGGYEPVKRFVLENVVAAIADKAALARELGLPLPRGILLFGPQGTGKTLLAKALAKEVDLPFINFRTENIYSQYLGVSGRLLSEATRLIDALGKAIVFIDEIDRFGKRVEARDSAGEETRRVFSQMLEWLGGRERESIVIGTTNRPGDLDPAFLRTGRFDYKIPMGFPDEAARRSILWIHLGRAGESSQIRRVTVLDESGSELSDPDLETFLEESVIPETELFKGSELEQLVIRCKREALRRGSSAITVGDFRSVLQQFRLNEERLRQIQQDFERDVAEFADDISLVEQPAAATA